MSLAALDLEGDLRMDLESLGQDPGIPGILVFNLNSCVSHFLHKCHLSV